MCLAQLQALEVLSSLGADVEVLALPGGRDPELPPSTRVRRLPSIPFLTGVPIGPSWRKVAWAPLLLAAAAWRLARTRHDVVVACEESAVFAALLKPFFRFRLVYDMDDVLSRRVVESGWLSHGLLTAAVRWAECFALRRADTVLTNSSETTCLAREIAGEERVHFYHHVPLGVEPSGASPERSEVLYAGNLEPYQGVGLLLEAMALLQVRRPGARLDVIGGSAIQARRLEERAQELGVSSAVRWLGPLPLAETFARIRAARVLVSPMTEHKAVPMKLYAYMDSGVPIVATALPNHTQLLDADCAVLVAPEPRALADGLGRVLDDPALGERLALEASRRRRAIAEESRVHRAWADACGFVGP